MKITPAVNVVKSALSSAKSKIKGVLVMAHVMTMSSPVMAQINKPELPDGTASSGNFFADLKKIFQGSGELVIYGLYILIFIFAVWLIVQGVAEGRKKGEWGQLIAGIIIAFVLVLVGSYFLAAGEEALQNLN